MAPSAFSPQQEAELDRRFNPVNAQLDQLTVLLNELKAELRAVIDTGLDQAFDKAFNPLKAPPPAPSELPPLPTPPAPKLPLQPIPPPAPARSYPPSPSVEALEEVEHIQVYKPLRNIRKLAIRQKHRAAKAMPKCRDVEVFDFDFENCIAWPPKFGGTNMHPSRDQYLDAWYTTMLNAHANELATQALPIRA